MVGLPDARRLERDAERADLGCAVSAPAGRLLWQPSAERIERAAITDFARAQGIEGDYEELWRWSVADVERFWRAVWDYFDVAGRARRDRSDHARDAGRRVVPRRRGLLTPSTSSAASATARSRSATPPSCASWRADLGRAARARRPGSGPGCSGSASAAATASPPTCRTSRRRSPPSSRLRLARRRLVLGGARVRRPQRHRPLRPDRAQGPARDRRLPLRRQGLRPPRDRRGDRRRAPRRSSTSSASATSAATQSGWEPGFLGPTDRRRSSRFERLPFSHPLWILYSSGTTGLPKAIVHSQGGILLEHLKKMHLHLDAGPGDRSSGSRRPAG